MSKKSGSGKKAGIVLILLGVLLILLLITYSVLDNMEIVPSFDYDVVLYSTVPITALILIIVGIIVIVKKKTIKSAYCKFCGYPLYGCKWDWDFGGTGIQFQGIIDGFFTFTYKCPKCELKGIVSKTLDVGGGDIESVALCYGEKLFKNEKYR